jgi:squalene-hopene/tetraprenyl-beta-curcumene cyclase
MNINAPHLRNQIPSAQTAAECASIAVDRAASDLLARQKADGHWAFELEADATIPAEYVLLRHYLGEIDRELEKGIVAYLWSIQGAHGGWPLFYGGDFNISASVKAYYALKICGENADDPRMKRARDAILAHGGAKTANVFTLIQLALFQQVPWRAVPVMPVEIMLLPKWFPFHLDRVSYWSRTVIVPLLVLMALKPQARNPTGVGVRELFQIEPEKVANWYNMNRKGAWASFFRGLDRLLRSMEGLFPKGRRSEAIRRAVAWINERLNGEDGLGAIYPAMANAVMMFDALGYAKDYPALVTAKAALEKLLITHSGITYCQPCLSPVWDTALAGHAMMEIGEDGKAAAERACDWLKERQILDVTGDWVASAPGVRPGGWAFQYNNAHYPDVDDTAVVAMLLDRVDRAKYRENIDRAAEWVLGLQSVDGGWGAFDANNRHYYLNHIPFADHGALLDPPTSDVTARCVSMLAQLGYSRADKRVAAALDFLRKEQEPEGCWFGRWGTIYIYGTWSVLCALNAIGVPSSDPMIKKAVAWLRAKQRDDGGWAEDGLSYWEGAPKGEGKRSTASQTSWALLALMAAGEVDLPEVERGVAFLESVQGPEGQWDEPDYTAVGFPRVFYLRYHGYRAFFPLWALARYRNLQRTNSRQVQLGM